MESPHWDREDETEPLDPRVALQLIINHEGDCSFTEVDCTNCPLARLHQRADGTFMSCYESIVGDRQMSMRESEVLYKQAAMDKLSDLLIDDILSGKVI